jgi:hypothetical protein
MKEKILTWLGFDTITLSTQSQYVTTELTDLMKCLYWSTSLKEDIKATWFVQLETEVV